MSELMRQRVRERLAALDINPYEAARRAGLERTFVNDLLIGKKSAVRHKNLAKLADALECDPDYLNGLQGSPKMGKGAAGGLRLIGVVEANTWRVEGAEPSLPSDPIPVLPDPRYPINEQAALLVRGDHAAALGVTDGSVLTIFTGQITLRDGDVVVVSKCRTAKDGEQEFQLSIQAITAKLLAERGQGAREPSLDDQTEVVGLVLSAQRVFGYRP